MHWPLCISYCCSVELLFNHSVLLLMQVTALGGQDCTLATSFVHLRNIMVTL